MDFTGIYADSPSEREEREATMAGAWGSDPDQTMFLPWDAAADEMEYQRELAYWSQDKNLIFM